MPGRAIALAVALLAPAIPALAEVIPLGAAFGNDAGCRFFLNGVADIDAVLLTPDTFMGSGIACDFTELAGVSAVAAICSGDEREGIVELGIDASEGAFTVVLGEATWGPLPRCAGSLTLERGTHA